jgi:hypothetical protein
MTKDAVPDIIAEFIIKAKSANDDKLAEAAIDDSLSKGARISQLEDGIVSYNIQGQNLKSPFGEEAASVPNTPECQNLFRVFTILKRRKGV